MIQRSLRMFSAALITVFCFSMIAAAQEVTANFTATQGAPIAAADFSHIKIGNFGRMDERYYRGAQPNPGDYQSLKDLGVNTIVDLRNDPTDYEQKEAEALGMKYVNIPMSGWKSPKMESINQFLALMNEPSTGVVYVHCKAGRHRASVIGAAWRYTKYGWDYDKVYKEMKDFNYSNGLVHGALGQFVKDWGTRLANEKENEARAAAKAGKATAKAAAQGTEN